MELDAERSDEVGAAEVAEAARSAMADPDAQVLEWGVSPISHVGVIDTTGGLLLATATVRTGGVERPWSGVLKVVVRAPGDECLAPSGWCYWRREAAFYASEVPARLSRSLRAPRPYAVFEREDSAHIWMERVDVSSRRWELGDFERAGRAAGRSAGGYLTGRKLPAEPWLSAGFLRSILADGGFWATYMDPAEGAAWRSPLMDAFDPAVRRRVLTLWADRDALLDLVDRLPRVFGHGDFHPRNLLIPAGRDEVVAFDWGFCGPAPLGGDLADLVSIAAWFCDIAMADVPAVEDAAFAGYLSGLSEEGWEGDPALVRLGYALHASLRSGACMPGWAALMLGPERAGSSETLFRRPVRDVLAAWVELADWCLEQADAARALAAGTGLVVR
jgi:Phosphotransferase enzyme family